MILRSFPSEHYKGEKEDTTGFIIPSKEVKFDKIC